MRVLTALLFSIVFGVPMLAQAPRAADDEAAVRDVVARYMAARDARDPAAIRSLFTGDADQYTTAGEWRRGRDNVVRGTLTSSERNPGARRIDVQAVRFIAPGVAIVDGAYEIGGPDEARRMWTTLVVTRGAAGWQIAAIRNAAPH